MSESVLKDDICRCRDDRCGERFGCLRWIERNCGGEWVPTVSTMRPDDEDTCTRKIPIHGRKA
jgi:hypothetical protein